MKLTFLKTGERLRNKILVGVILVACIPFVASGLYALYLINQAHESDIARIEGNLLNEKTVEIKKYVSDSLDELAVVVSLPSDSLARYLRPGESFSDAALVRQLPDGRRIVFAIDPPSQLDDILKEALRSNKNFNELYIIDAGTGLELSYHSNDPANDAARVPFEDFSQLPGYEAAKNGGTYVGPVNFTMNGPVLDMAAPVKNTNGVVVGVMGGELSLSGLKSVFSGTALGTMGYAYLLDHDGALLYSSDESKLPGAGGRIAASANEVPEGVDLTVSVDQLRYRSFWGQDVVAAARRVLIADTGTPWVVVAEWPTADADQVINVMVGQFTLFLFILILLTLSLSVFLANSIAKPVDILRQGTERVAEGKLDEQVTIRTNDELEDLGSAFNEMIKGLKRLRELQDEFVFIAAHELRTPVAAMKGYLSIILSGAAGAVSDEAKALVDKVIGANNRLIQLVNDLLETSRSEAGRLTIKLAEGDIVEPIRGTLAELRSLADEKSIVLAYEPQPGLPLVMMDPDRVKEVVTNLVGNAIKYSEKGKTITVSHELREDVLVTRVADQGFGISKEAQEKLFQKFYRVQTERTREITGTGLGLFIVKEIVEKMNGTIWVDSEEGKGSAFSFSLKIATNQ